MGDWIDKLYEQELKELREEFNEWVTDPETMKKWLFKYKDLPYTKLAAISQRSIPWIYKLCRRYGFKKRGHTKPPPSRVCHKRKELEFTPEPTDQWIKEKFQQGYKIVEICNATDKSKNYVRKRIKGLEKTVIFKNTKLRQAAFNPCCSERWLRKHLIEKNLSQSKCAKLAGVSRYTIITWMARFGIIKAHRHSNKNANR